MTRSSRPNSPGHHYHHHHHHQHIHIHNAHAAIHTPAPRHYQQPNSYIYFPAPESMSSGADHEEAEAEAAYHPPPPQTVHYWMSDSTRRMEYAAIDAASRGVKGWIIKHVVPNCLVPKSCRRLTFDDDTGSVRRYRLELDCDGEEGKSGKKLGWLLGRS
ncbi:hypothetical protein GGS21DRAFT_519923 [Xylaria nigripes]|nr:hypothetical protein GGS21DRAFT_519923 [Xylaria nigripes]